jgi:replicative DNA helicase
MSDPANNALPANVDAERSILGAILLNNAAYTETAEHLKPEDFLLDSHRRIYRRMAKLAESSRSIDLITLTEELSRHGECASIGGAAYITGLLDGVPDRPSIANYVRIVRDKALARGIIHTATAAIARASDQSDDVHEILSGLSEHVANLAQRGAGGETLGHTYEEILSVPAVEFVIDGFFAGCGRNSHWRAFRPRENAHHAGDGAGPT